MAKEAKIDYDEEYDILYVYTGEKAKDSLEIDRFVLDFSAENRIVGVEVLDASKIISKLTGVDLNKDNLSNISSAKIQYYQSKELFYVVIILMVKVNEKEKELTIQIPTPSTVMTI
jgi:uncharacterized protein YuzE